MFNSQSIQATQNDYHELMSCIDEQELLWKTKMETANGEELDIIRKKLTLLLESRKSINELYSIYFDCPRENWEQVVQKASRAFKMTIDFENMG